jgi:hypothetical protein
MWSSPRLEAKGANSGMMDTYMDTFSVKKLYRTVMFLYVGLRSVSEVGLDFPISFGELFGNVLCWNGRNNDTVLSVLPVYWCCYLVI